MYPDGSHVTTTYDGVGNRVLVEDTAGRYTRTYDPLNLTTAVANPDGTRLTFAYDPLSRREVLIDAKGGRSTTAYDPAGRVANLIDPQGGRTTYQYDAAGRNTAMELPNDTRTSQVFNAAGWITDIVHQTSANTVFESFAYQYDNVGNRTRVVEDSGDIVTWTYDKTYQLTSEHRTGINDYRTTWTYDPSGNRLIEDADGAVTTSTYNAANQLLWSEDSLNARTTYT